MTDLLLRTFLSFLALAAAAASFQNIAFVKGFGLSNIIRFPKEHTDIAQMGILLFFATEIAALLDFLADYYIFHGTVPDPFRGVATAVYAIAAYYILYLLIKLMLLQRDFEKAAGLLPSVCFSYAVLGTLNIIDVSGYTLVQSLGYGAGSAIGYIIALILTVEGYKKVSSEAVPRIFRGMPALLLYLSGLMLAILGLSQNI